MTASHRGPPFPNGVRLVPPRGRDWLLTAAFVAVFVAVLVSAFAAHLVWLGAVATFGGGAALVTWHSRAFGYHCPSCGTDFTVGVVADLVGPSWWRAGAPVKRVRCPSCHRREFLAPMKRRDPVGPVR